MIPNFRQVRSEDALPAWRRMVAHMRRLLDGQDLDLVGTVAVNLIIDVIVIETGDDVGAAEAAVDELAAALKASVRACIARDQETTQ